MKKKIHKLEYSKKFEKQLTKAPTQIKRAWRKRLEVFLQDPSSPQLRNHALTGTHTGLRSINVTGDWRALFAEAIDSDGLVITFKALGTHSQLYR